MTDQLSVRTRFDRHTRVREVALLEGGSELLYRHGYDVGRGFVDTLSQWQSLDEARRAGRLRDLDGLLETLNRRS